MNSMNMNETENQVRLRRSKEALLCYRYTEDEARKNLAIAVELTKRAREKYEELFMAEEKAEQQRLIESYNHCPK